LLNWKAALEPAARDLAAATQNFDPDDFAAVLEDRADATYQDLIAGIRRYRAFPWSRPETTAPVIWQAGTAKLYDHGARRPKSPRPPVLMVPSLVNRSHVLDLMPGRSLAAYLARRGLRPLVLDWGTPDETERRFTLDDYFTERLLPAFEAARALSSGPVLVAGYCMGGLLTLALAQQCRADVSGLALLAVPWDFHAERKAQAQHLAALVGAWLPGLTGAGVLPVEGLQTLFTLNDPYLACRKFTRFATMDPEADGTRHFVALEDWLNDGIPMAWDVARTCFLEWYATNATVEGTWSLGGEVVDPSQVDAPAIGFLPANDRIVPPRSAAALVEALPNAEAVTVPAGHIGMVTGSRRKALWQPLARWMLDHP
jgi:polyhydroxyalkanoate synthase